MEVLFGHHNIGSHHEVMFKDDIDVQTFYFALKKRVDTLENLEKSLIRFTQKIKF